MSRHRADSPPRKAGLGRNTLTTSIGALGGILTGLALDVAIAATFGAGRATDALFVAMRIPIGITAVIMAGANQSLVPTFAGWLLDRDRRDAFREITSIFILTAVGGSLLALLGVLVSHPLMRVTAPGLPAAEITEAAHLARIMFWLIPLVALAEVLRAYMNARRLFGVPAGMNVVMNGLAAAIVIAFAHHRIEVAAWAYIVGAVAQLVFMLVAGAVAGLRVVPTVHLLTPGVRMTGRVSVRPLVSSGMNPAMRVVEQLFVSFLPPGSITILNYANRLISAIGGTVFFRSVMVVLLPRMTEAWKRKDEQGIRHWTARGLSVMTVLSLPLTAGMLVLSVPGAVAIFHRGRFARSDAIVLGIALAVYATSLVGQATQRAVLAPFYAALEMKPPFRNTVYGILANLVFLPLFVLPLHRRPDATLYAVAVAYSLSQYVNLGHGWFVLRRRVGPFVDAAAWRVGAVQVGAALLMTAVGAGGYRLLELSAPWSRVNLLARTAIVGTAALAVFVCVIAAVEWRSPGHALVPAAGNRSGGRRRIRRAVVLSGTIAMAACALAVVVAVIGPATPVSG